MERARAPRLAGSRARRALRHPGNWIQLAKFSAVGASGYLVNLAVYAALLRGAGLHYLPAAACSFAVAVSTVSLGANLLILRGLVAWDLDKIGSQALAIVLVTPLNFVGNRLWSFAPRSSQGGS